MTCYYVFTIVLKYLLIMIHFHRKHIYPQKYACEHPWVYRLLKVILLFPWRGGGHRSLTGEVLNVSDFPILQISVISIRLFRYQVFYNIDGKEYRKVTTQSAWCLEGGGRKCSSFHWLDSRPRSVFSLSCLPPRVNRTQLEWAATLSFSIPLVSAHRGWPRGK